MHENLVLQRVRVCATVIQTSETQCEPGDNMLHAFQHSIKLLYQASGNSLSCVEDRDCAQIHLSSLHCFSAGNCSKEARDMHFSHSQSVSAIDHATTTSRRPSNIMTSIRWCMSSQQCLTDLLQIVPEDLTQRPSVQKEERPCP